jgi:hypothetical protein
MTPEWYTFDETFLWKYSETKAACERFREASKVDWPTGSTPCPTVLHVAGYRPTALQTLPIRTGTARRLGLHSPTRKRHEHMGGAP